MLHEPTQPDFEPAESDPNRAISPAEESAAAPPSERDRLHLAGLAALFGAAAAAAKMFVAAVHEVEGGSAIWRAGAFPAPLVVRVAGCFAEDVAIALLLLAAVPVALAVSDRRWYRRFLVCAAYAASAGALAFLVMDVSLYGEMRRFLNWPMFVTGGRLNVSRHVLNFVTPAIWVGLIASPIALTAFVAVLSRRNSGLVRFPAWAGRRHRPLTLLLPASLMLWTISGWVRAGWMREDNTDFARNPHLLFAESVFWKVDFDEFGTGLRPKVIDFGNLDASDPETADFVPGRPRLSQHPRARRPRNIILVVWDAVPAQYLQLYGCRLKTTPQLCALAGQSLVFDNVQSSAACTPASMLPIFASTHNDPHAPCSLDQYPTLPYPHAVRWLSNLGYKSYFMANADWNWGPFGNVLRNSFELARDSFQHWSRQTRPWPFLRHEHDDAAVVLDGLKCLREAGKDKFLLVLWTADCHPPIRSGDGPDDFDLSFFDRRYLNDTHCLDYLKSIWRADRLLGHLHRELEALGLADDTMIVFTADHGQAYDQHGFISQGLTLYQEETHIPLVFIWKHLAEAGTRSQVIGSQVDLWPTLADVMGLPPHPLWQGHSLVGEPTAENRRAYFSNLDAMGVREGDLKYIWNFVTRVEHLYDLAADPGERRNLAAERPGKCRELLRRLKNWADFQQQFLRERLATVSKSSGE